MEELWLQAGSFEKRLWLFYRDIHSAIEEMFMPILEAEGVTAPQLRILLSVAEQAGIPVGELAERIRMNSGNCSTVCKRLEQKGLLRRERSSADERIVLLRLDAAGRQLVNRLLQAVHQQQAPLLASLSEAEQSSISADLSRLEDFFRRLRTGQDAPAKS